MTNERNINRPTDTDTALDQLLALAEPVPLSPQIAKGILEEVESLPADLPPASPNLKAEILAATANVSSFPLRPFHRQVQTVGNEDTSGGVPGFQPRRSRQDWKPARGGRPGWGSAQNLQSPHTLEDPHPSPPPQRGREMWAAGGLMAASVVLGLWLGNAGITDTYLRPTLSVVGLAQPDDDQLFTSDDYLGLGTADTNGEVM